MTHLHPENSECDNECPINITGHKHCDKNLYTFFENSSAV
jgi:hypothetical protein